MQIWHSRIFNTIQNRSLILEADFVNNFTRGCRRWIWLQSVGILLSGNSSSSQSQCFSSEVGMAVMCDSIGRVHKLSKMTESVHASLDLPETSYMNGQQLWSLMKELLEIFLGKLVRRSPTLHRIHHWRIKMYGRIKKKASRSKLHCFYFPLRHLLEQKVDWSASPSSMRPL